MELKTKIFIRADGNSQIGLGHVIRSLALAEMLCTYFECHFIIRKPLISIKSQIIAVCKSIIELPETDDHEAEARLLAEKHLHGNEIIVLDGYYFNTDYQRIIKSKGCKLVCIDDIHSYHFVADAVINHAGGITSQDYSAEYYTRFFLGLEYALLRKPFREAAKNRNFENKEDSILICFGGADPQNDTLKALTDCERLYPIETYYVVTGAAFLHYDKLNSYIFSSKKDIEVLSDLSAGQIVEYMKKCKIAITSPSTIAFEYISVGGVLLLKVIADNQKDIFKYFLKEGLAFSFEGFVRISNEEMGKVLKKQELLLDGRADIRLLDFFKSLQADA